MRKINEVSSVNEMELFLCVCVFAEISWHGTCSPEKREVEKSSRFFLWQVFFWSRIIIIMMRWRSPEKVFFLLGGFFYKQKLLCKDASILASFYGATSINCSPGIFFWGFPGEKYIKGDVWLQKMMKWSDGAYFLFLALIIRRSQRSVDMCIFWWFIRHKKCVYSDKMGYFTYFCWLWRK